MPTLTFSQRRYSCTYAPLDRDQIPVQNDTGVMPKVQVRARNAEDAQRAAHAKTGCPIVLVERVEAA